jgi:hypothetical protein
MTSIASPNIAHSGFNDLIDLVSSTTSRLGVALYNSRFYPEQESYPGDMGKRLPELDKGKGKAPAVAGVRYEQTKARANVDPADIKATGRRVGPGGGQGMRQRAGDIKGKGPRREEAAAVVHNGLRYRKVDKRSIGAPTDFR